MVGTPPATVFGADYRLVSSRLLTAQRTAAEVDLIIKLTTLEPGMSVLDLGCGSGRVSWELARRGLAVVGLDCDEGAIAQAERYPVAGQHSVVCPELPQFVCGDMRDLRFRHRFDAVISWYTSLGYFDDATERSILRGVFDALRSGGRFLLEHVNRDRVLRSYQHYDIEEHDGVMMVDHNTYDVCTGRTVKTRRFVGPGTTTDELSYAIRLFTFPEIRDWLVQAGFRVVRGYGARGESFDLDSARMIVVAS